MSLVSGASASRFTCCVPLRGLMNLSEAPFTHEVLSPPREHSAIETSWPLLHTHFCALTAVGAGDWERAALIFRLPVTHGLSPPSPPPFVVCLLLICKHIPRQTHVCACVCMSVCTHTRAHLGRSFFSAPGTPRGVLELGLLNNDAALPSRATALLSRAQAARRSEARCGPPRVAALCGPA